MTIDAKLARKLLHEMVRIRRFEEKAAELYSAGKIRGFLHLYIGEEAVATGAMQALRPDDAVFATYREHGHALVRGDRNLLFQAITNLLDNAVSFARPGDTVAVRAHRIGDGVQHLHVLGVRVVARKGIVELAVERHHLAADRLQHLRGEGAGRAVAGGRGKEQGDQRK